MPPNASDPRPATWRDFTVEAVSETDVMVLCRLDGSCEENLTRFPDTADNGYLTLGEAVAWAQAHAASFYHRDPETPEPDTDLDRVTAIWADHTRLPQLKAGSADRIELANRLMSEDVPWLLAEVERLRAQLQRRDDVIEAAKAAADDIRALTSAKSKAARGLLAAVDAMGPGTPTTPPPWPGYPFPEQVYLITADGQWPVHAATCEAHAIADAERRAERSQGHQVRIWKITSVEVDELAVQREIVRKALVPRGTETNS